MSKIESVAPPPLPLDNVSSEEKVAMRRVANQMESIFVNHLLGEMRKTVDKSEFTKPSQGEKIYQSMLDNEYSQNVAESQQLGLSDLVYEHLLRTRLGQ